MAGVFGDTADHFLALFFAVDDADGDFDESKWVKANPLIDVNPNLLVALRKEAAEAKAMPSKLAEFQIKRLNRPAAHLVGVEILELMRGLSADESRSTGAPCFHLRTGDAESRIRLPDGRSETRYVRTCPDQSGRYRVVD